MTLRNTLITLTALAGVALGTGCGSDEVPEDRFICEDPKEISRKLIPSGSYGPTVRGVPAVSYKVQRGDNFIELVDVAGAAKFTTGYNYPSSVLMSGDQPDVHYVFGLEEFVVEANPNYNPEKGLFYGVNLVFPDFDEDGKINGVPGEQVGKFTVSGQRDQYDIFDVSCRTTDNFWRYEYRGHSNEVEKGITFTRTP